MRLIDADVFDSILRDAQAKCKKSGGNFRFGFLNSVRANLANQPTIDAMPVVLCRECRYWRQEVSPTEHWVCAHHSFNERKMYTTPDFYCADGERRDDDETD